MEVLTIRHFGCSMAGVSLSMRLIVLLLLNYFSFVLSVTCKGCAANFINALALGNHLGKNRR